MKRVSKLSTFSSQNSHTVYLEHGAIANAVPGSVEHGSDPGPKVALVEGQAKLLALIGGVDLGPVGVIDHGALFGKGNHEMSLRQK